MRLYLALVSLIFWAFVLLSSILSCTCSLLARLLTPTDKRRRASHRVAVVWASVCIGLLRIFGVCKLRVEGMDKLPQDRASTIIANHGSQLDILCSFCSGLDFKWVSKASMKYVPFVGWGMWLAGYVFLKRDDSASIKEMLRECGEHIERGSSVFVFPEGTRTKDGKIQPFKPGGFMIAKRTGSPIVPMTITGTHAALPPKHIFFKQRMEIHIRLLDPIPAEEVESTSAKEMAKRCEELYRTQLDSAS